MLMIRPPADMCRTAACTATNGARTLTATVWSKSSRDSSSSGPSRPMPALLTRMSSPPNSLTVFSTVSATAVGSALSAWSATALRPVAVIRSTVSLAFSAFRW
jgi:hypothetical protein